MLNTKDLEAQILGTLLGGGGSALTMLHDVGTRDFDLPAHRDIYQACLQLDQDDSEISYPTVGGMLAGNKLAIHELAGLNGGVTGLLPHLVRELRSVKALQRAIDTSKRIAVLDNGQGGILTDRIAEAQRLAQEILTCTQAKSRDVLISFGEVAGLEIERLDKIAEGGPPPETLQIGIRDLDEILYIEPGQFVVIGGETASGKSALCGQIAAHQAARKRAPVVFVTSEMHHRQMIVRILASLKCIPVTTLTNPRFAMELRAQGLYKSLGDLPIYFQRSFPPRIEEAVAAIRTGVAKHGATVAIIDYAQRLAEADDENQEKAIARIAHESKNLALELGIVVIAAAQVNRQVSQRQGDFRPKLADLRGSGRLEQDADCVLFTYQPGRHGKPGDPEIIVAKQRNGKAGVAVPVSFDAVTCTFYGREDGRAGA